MILSVESLRGQGGGGGAVGVGKRKIRKTEGKRLLSSFGIPSSRWKRKGSTTTTFENAAASKKEKKNKGKNYSEKGKGNMYSSQRRISLARRKKRPGSKRLDEKAVHEKREERITGGKSGGSHLRVFLLGPSERKKMFGRRGLQSNGKEGSSS